MLELEQLLHLVTFYEEGTLSQASQKLHISQPVLTRSMQKLEEELDVSLFVRTKNRISFNKNGKYAVELAQRILQDTNHFKQQLKAFDRSHHTISIGTCAPAPHIELTQKITQIYPDKTISHEIKDTDKLIQGLKDHTYTLIIMPYGIEDDDTIEAIPFMEEQLFFSLPLHHRFANKESLSLKEMDGEKMLLMSNIGFWHEMHKRTMPHTKFLLQQDRSVFYDLIELSQLPSFTSDYMMNIEGRRQNRKIIPISDEDAHATFYCWYLKEDEEDLKTLLYLL